MKLLRDENLGRRLVPVLQVRFPASNQVVLLGLERAPDAEPCDVAARQGYVLVSRDDGFLRLVAARGCRPRLVPLAPGNDAVLAALPAAAERVASASADSAIGVVTIE